MNEELKIIRSIYVKLSNWKFIEKIASTLQNYSNIGKTLIIDTIIDVIKNTYEGKKTLAITIAKIVGIDEKTFETIFTENPKLDELVNYIDRLRLVKIILDKLEMNDISNEIDYVINVMMSKLKKGEEE